MIRRFCLLLIAAIGIIGQADAHLLPAQTATMNVVGNTTYFVVSVPLSALRGIDDDGSGGASQVEIARHSREIAQQFNQRFSVTADGMAGTPLMTMAWSPETEGQAANTRYIVVLHSVRFAAPPQNPVVSTDLFGTGSGEGQMTITAKRDKRDDTAEVAILRPAAAEHRFFRGSLATFADFVRVGIEHILTGPDHLLFLLTIIVAAAGWRYWLSVVTSFTIAHSITLTVAALGLIKVSPAIVEPGIAASIILMAVLNLWRGGRVSPSEARARIAIVFACGLLHGLGFASAIGAMAANGAHRLATLAGFNVGIELGQFAFLASVLALVGLVRGVMTIPPIFALPRLASVTAAVLGALMLFARVLPVLPSVT